MNACTLMARISIAASFAMVAVAEAQPDFEACVGALRERAVSAGVSSETAERALADVSRLERVVRADRNQPEFVSTFADYYSRRVTAQRIETGRQLMNRHAAELAGLTERYGVPGQYLVALWGMESNYGSVLGNVPVFDSLSTLACDERRSEYFSEQLVNALRIVDRGHAEPDEMLGSWAGAMGQTQFTPAAFLSYAVDGDGDGRIDLWNSTLDALASGANYLSTHGWQAGYSWGREVVLPEGFDYSTAGRGEASSLSEWRERGIRDTADRLVADLDIEASVLVPAGHTGPGFVVYENFDVLMRWNPSEFFALSVGRLADRIAGAAPLRNPPADGPRLTRAAVERVQRRLNELSYEAGPVDGLPGSATRAAVRAYELDNGMVADGYIDAALVDALASD